ncbi:MAG: tol-pal system protein YbgF [Pseudomonadota bacterium]
MKRETFRSLVNPLLRLTLVPISVCLIFFPNGCVFKKEVVKLEYDLNSLQRQVSGLKKDGEQLRDLARDRSKELDQKIGEIGNRIAKVEANIRESITPVRKNQADTGARLDNVQLQLQSLGGKIEEYRYLLNEKNKESIVLKKGWESEVKNVNAKLSELEKRVLFVEGFFISERAPSEGKGLPEEKPSGETEEEKATPEGKKSDREELYNKAISEFKKGNTESARIGFRKYLALFPKTDFSDNAQYWIGESFFVEKKYREAILEFEEVVRKYPKGNKVPSALLKQGLAFYRLGDKTSAKLLLQKAIKDYPRSDQARIAKNELKKLK